MSAPAISVPIEDSLPECPFPGIEAFSYARHRVFFSRDEEIRALSRSIVLHRGVLLYAASGTGKSSLINAGIIPRAIEEGYQPERIRVQPKVGQEIVIEPIRAFADKRPDTLPSIFVGANDKSERIVLSVEEFLSCLERTPGAVSPLLVFDQFEEWVTLFDEAATEENRSKLNNSREKIRTAICRIINDSSLPVKVLIALREDYLASLAPLFRDVPSLPDNYLRLKPLSSDQVSDVIRKPYEKYPGAFAVELGSSLAVMIREQFEQRVAGGDIQLTEVQIVCRTLFEHAAKGGNAGQLFAEKGVQGILEDYLETALNNLGPAAREPALAVLSRLITSSGTRNVVSEDNLIRWLGKEEKIPADIVRAAQRNLEHDARLIRCEPRRGVNYYEINSEFLVPWIQREAIARETQRQIQELRRQEEKQHRAFRQKLRLRATSTVAAALILLALVVWIRGRNERKMRLHSVAEALAVRSMADSGEVGQLLASEAVAIHNKADSTHFSGLIGTALSAALSTPVMSLARFPGAINSLSTDTAGRFLAMVANGRIFLLDLGHPKAEPAEVGEFEPVAFRSVALSRDGSKLVGGTSGGQVFLWQLSPSGREPRLFSADTMPVYGVDISPDGRRLAAASGDGIVRFWDTSGGEGSGRTLYTGRSMAWSVRFGDDENALFTGSVDGGIQGWDLRLPQSPVISLPGVSLAISHDGKWIASGAMDGKVRLWRMNNRRTPEREFASHRGPIRSVALTRDGTALASTGDTTVQLWILRPNAPVHAMTGKHKSSASYALFSHDGKSLISAGGDGELKSWTDILGSNGYPLMISGPNVDSGTVSSAALNMTARVVATATTRRSFESGALGATSATRAGSSDAVWLYDMAGATASPQFVSDSASDVVVALSGDGMSLAATGRGDRAIRFLRRDKPGIELVLGQRQDSIKTIALSADGELLAESGKDKAVRIWNTRFPQRRPLRLKGVGDAVHSLAFSPDGKRLAAGTDSGTARVWELARPDTSLEIVAHDGAVRALTFSLDGRFLGSGGDDGKVSIWDVADPHKTAVVFPAGKAAVTTVLFRPDNHLIFAGSSDGTLAFWSMQEGNASPVRLDTHSGAVRAIALSRRADTLYSVGADGRVLAWLIDNQALAKRICERVGRNLSFAEWRYYVPTEMQYELTCPRHGTPPANTDEIKKAIRQEDVDHARRMRKAINKLDSTQTYDVDAGIIFSHAERLARDGQLDSAIALARQAGLSVRGSPQAFDAFDKIASILVARAKVLADSGGFAEATTLVTKILAFLPEGSKLAAKSMSRIIQPIFLDPSLRLAQAGKVDSALTSLGKARTLVADTEIPAVYWNNLCWWSSLWERPKEVMADCERAVAMRPGNGNYRDSRGVARALVGNSKGAIEDFTFFVGSGADARTREERLRWIVTLRAKGNPFTPEKLRALRNE